jgi:hypothetical protein
MLNTCGLSIIFFNIIWDLGLVELSYNLSSVLKSIVTFVTLCYFCFSYISFGWGSNEKGWKRVWCPSGLELEEILSNLKFPFWVLNWC